MNKVKVYNGQTLIDIAVQELGDPARVMEVAELNDMNVTDELVSGAMVIVPVFDKSKRSHVILFADPANRPASGLNINEAALPEGIGYWYLENDFIVQ